MSSIVKGFDELLDSARLLLDSPEDDDTLLDETEEQDPAPSDIALLRG